jgi:transposase
MGQNFLAFDREQAFLMLPSLREWLAEDHFAWFVIEAVEQLDLSAFLAACRPGGHGRAAYHPAVMVSLLSYAYATGECSSRGIERRCRQNVAYRVITANRVPDHATIARFVCRHEGRLGELSARCLRLCEKAGMVSAGVVAIDGTKLAGSASPNVNVDYGQIAKELIANAIATNQAEDQQHGDARGDEMPTELSTDEGRRAWLARELAGDRAAAEECCGGRDAEAPLAFDAEQIVARDQGREG